MYPLTIHKLMPGGGESLGGRLSFIMNRPSSFPTPTQTAQPPVCPAAHSGSTSLLTCRTPHELCDRIQSHPISPSLDEGYSSVSSLSALTQLNRDSLEPIFNSTPVHLNIHQKIPGAQFDTDPGCSGCRTMNISAVGQKLLPNTPTCSDSFWTSFGTELHRRASLMDPTTALVTPVVQPTPVGLFAPENQHPMLSVFQSIPQLSGWTHQSIHEMHPVFHGCTQEGKLSIIKNYGSYGADNVDTQGVHNQLLSNVRAEMMLLVENSVKHLEKYLAKSFVAPGVSVGKHTYQESECAPLNLKSIPQEKLTSYNDSLSTLPHKDCRFHQTVSNSDPTGGSFLARTDEMGVRKPSVSASTLTETGKCAEQEHRSPSKRTTPVCRRRRNRIRTGVRRLRVRQFSSRLMDGHRRTQNEDSVVLGYEGTLDLRMRPSMNSKRAIVEAAVVPLKETGGACSYPQPKVSSLSASHLKRAKLMFMYARYPASSALKSFFPEVAFTRATTAQIVKWFSNFR